MYTLLCIFAPSLLSIRLEQILLKTKREPLDLLINYGIYCLLNSLITITIMVTIFNIKYYFEESINLYPAITIKYMLVSIVFAILLSVIKVIISKNIGVEIEVKNKNNN